MRIYVKVIPRSSKEEIIKISDQEYRIKVNAAPEKNRANERVVEMLAKHFKISKSSVNIIVGKTARTKIVDIDL